MNDDINSQIRTPWFSYKGPLIGIMVFVSALGVVALLVGGVLHMQQVKMEDDQTRNTTIKGLEQLKKAQEATTEAQVQTTKRLEEITWVLTVPIEKRERLELDVPETFRGKLRERR